MSDTLYMFNHGSEAIEVKFHHNQIDASVPPFRVVQPRAFEVHRVHDGRRLIENELWYLDAGGGLASLRVDAGFNIAPPGPGYVGPYVYVRFFALRDGRDIGAPFKHIDYLDHNRSRKRAWLDTAPPGFYRGDKKWPVVWRVADL